MSDLLATGQPVASETADALDAPPPPGPLRARLLSAPDRYASMLELAGHELSLAGSGHFEEICELASTWSALTAALPAQPAPANHATLTHIAELQQRTRETLLARRDEMLDDLQRTSRASRAASGYARTAKQLAPAVDRSA